MAHVSETGDGVAIREALSRLHYGIYILTVEHGGERNGMPVEPGAEFPPGDHRVYVFFEYEGMARGATWTYRWCKDGECTDGMTCLWGMPARECPWVSTLAGSTYLFFKPINGYEPGRYEVRLWIEDRLQFAEPFVIRSAP